MNFETADMLHYQDDDLIWLPPLIETLVDFLIWCMIFGFFFGLGTFMLISTAPSGSPMQIPFFMIGSGLVTCGSYTAYLACWHREIRLGANGQLSMYRVAGSRRKLKESVQLDAQMPAVVLLQRRFEHRQLFHATIVKDDGQRFELHSSPSLARVRAVAVAAARHLGLNLQDEAGSIELLSPEEAGLPLIERLKDVPDSFPTAGDLINVRLAEDRGVRQIVISPIGFYFPYALGIGVGFLFMFPPLAYAFPAPLEYFEGLRLDGKLLAGAWLLAALGWIAHFVVEGFFIRTKIELDAEALILEKSCFGMRRQQRIPFNDLYDVAVIDAADTVFVNHRHVRLCSSTRHFYVAHQHPTSDLEYIRGIIVDHMRGVGRSTSSSVWI